MRDNILQGRNKVRSTAVSPFVKLLPVVGLLFLGTIAYRNSFDGPFVFDDLYSIRNTFEVPISDYLTPTAFLRSRFLLAFTFALNNFVGGSDVWGYHLTNLALHLLNGILLFAIGMQLFPRLVDEIRVRAYSFLTAGFFLLHPLQTESVTYLSSRSELLSTFFYLGAIFLFVRVPSHKIGFVTSGMVSLLLLFGLTGKETAITLPAAIFLIDYLFIARTSVASILSRWRFYLPFLVGGLIASVYIVLVFLRPSLNTGLTLSPWHYLLTQSRVIMKYIQLIVLPMDLNLDHDFKASLSILEPAVIVSSMVIFALIGIACRIKNTAPAYAFGILWFFITLGPTSSFVPIVDYIFEHRLYLPLAGISFAFPMFLEWVVGFVADRKAVASVTALGVGTLLVLMVATTRRNEVWRDEVSLYKDIVAKSPGKLRGYNGLALTYLNRGQLDDAISALKQGLENVPEGRISTLETLGSFYLNGGRYAEAIDSFKRAVNEATAAGSDETTFGRLYNDIGVAYRRNADDLETLRGQIDEQDLLTKKSEALREARLALEKSAELLPGELWVQDSLVAVIHASGEGEAYAAELAAKLEEKGNELRVLYCLGALRSLQERFAESVTYFEQAEKLNSSSTLLYFNYAFALARAGEKDRAIEKYRSALMIDPTMNAAQYNLSLLYIEKSDFDSAIVHLQDILAREPGNVQSHIKVAEIYLFQGKIPAARQHLESVLAVAPGNARAMELLQKIRS